mmetsp:Transcript_126758/g.370488  ORF Transcript_126758/g.370488 Transcript_126758/m.370488 type:complete len:903 (+) Transcript_126758:127-2835(+)
MFDFSEIESAAASRHVTWKEFLAEGEVYALTIPERAEHIEDLLDKWEFTNANVFFGILKETIRLDEWAKQGKIQRNENVTEGRVACHFGHRGIMEEFLNKAPKSKKWLLIFEDDLIETPTDEMQHQLLRFWAEVPEDFDLLHLGFLWEDRHGREQVSALVYRTSMAVGRHAYMVTRKGAETLLKATYPQKEAGDEMYKKAIHDHNMAAYQPPEPLFRQDREKFMSKILMYKRPARDFRPDQEALKKWQADAQAAKTRYKDMSEERKQQLTNVDPKMLEALAAKYEDKKHNPKIDVKEPLLLVGSINDWGPEEARKAHHFSILRETNVSELLGEWRIADGKSLFIMKSDDGGLRAKVEIMPGTDVEGPLEEEADGWRLAELSFADGNGLGSVRLRWDKARDRGVMRFKFATDAEWGEESSMEMVRQDDEGLEVEHCLTLHLPSNNAKPTEFQVISDRLLWDWRLYPATGAKSLTLRLGERESVPCAISVDKDDMSYHGRNFTIHERRGGTFTIRVLLKRRGRFVWYTKGEERLPPRQPAVGEPRPQQLPFTPSAWGQIPVAGLGQTPETMMEATRDPREYVIDMVLPVRIVGDFINWDTKAQGCEFFPDPFRSEDEWRLYRLQVRLTDGRLDFQIASTRFGLNWRCYPELAKNGLCVLEKYNSGQAAHSKIGGAQDGDGRCFSIREAKGTLVAIFVWLKADPMPLHMGIGDRCTAAEVAYERVPGSPGRCISFGMNPQANYRISQIHPVRLVGECVKWNTRAPGLEFKLHNESSSDEWQEHRLCCRLQGDHLDFQIVSSSLGFEWRCYPKAVERGLSKLPPGKKNNVETAIGGKKDGHGRNFRVEEPAFTVVTISVWLRAALEPDSGFSERCGQVMVTYAVEDTGLTVGIGPSHVQFPLKKRR